MKWIKVYKITSSINSYSQSLKHLSPLIKQHKTTLRDSQSHNHDNIKQQQNSTFPVSSPRIRNDKASKQLSVIGISVSIKSLILLSLIKCWINQIAQIASKCCRKPGDKYFLYAETMLNYRF